jgi:hypothetical protein
VATVAGYSGHNNGSKARRACCGTGSCKAMIGVEVGNMCGVLNNVLTPSGIRGGELVAGKLGSRGMEGMVR